MHPGTEQRCFPKAVLRRFLPAVAAMVLLSSPVSAANGCLDCHAGQDQWFPAPDVSLYWYGHQPSQDGGHGDDDGFPALECSGSLGCHDISDAAAHRNGILEGVGSPSTNTFHLQDRFVTPAGSAPWSHAEAFNTACLTVCHTMYGIAVCAGDGHSLDSDIPGTPRFGYSGTPADADGDVCGRPVLLPLDSDITSAALSDTSAYALCVSCHDPHGTGTSDPYRQVNSMLRLKWASQSDLCKACHMSSPSSDDGDGDGIPDCIDPFPDSPGGTAQYVSQSLREMSASLLSAEDSLRGMEVRKQNVLRRFLARKLTAAASAVDREKFFHASAMLNRTLALLESGRRLQTAMSEEEKNELQRELEFLLELVGYLL